MATSKHTLLSKEIMLVMTDTCHAFACMHWVTCLCMAWDSAFHVLQKSFTKRNHVSWSVYDAQFAKLHEKVKKFGVSMCGGRHLSCWTSIHCQGKRLPDGCPGMCMNTLTDGHLNMRVCACNFIMVAEPEKPYSYYDILIRSRKWVSPWVEC